MEILATKMVHELKNMKRLNKIKIKYDPILVFIVLIIIIIIIIKGIFLSPKLSLPVK